MTELVLAVALAATPITLEEVREVSRRQNNAAQLANLDQAIAREQLRIARSAIFPQVNLDGRISRTARAPQTNFFTRQVGDQADVTIIQDIRHSPASHTGIWDLSVTLTQLIYDGGKWWNQIAQAGAQEEAAIGKATEQQNTSEFEGVRRFYELYRAQKSLDVLLASVKRSEDYLDRANAMYQAGRLAKGDVYAAEVNLGNDQISAAKQRSQIASAQADLATWIAHPGMEDLVATEPAAVVAEPLPGVQPEKAFTLARDNRPLLKQLQQQARAASLAIDIARSGFLPRLSGSGSVGRQAPNYIYWTTDFRDQNYATIGLTLHWDIFSGFLTDAQTTQARYQKSEADLNLWEAGREVEGDLHRTLVNLDVQIESLKIATKNRQAAVEGLTFADERFKAGAANTLEVRDAQLKLTQAELSQLSTRIDVEIARANVSRVMGTNLSGANP